VVAAHFPELWDESEIDRWKEPLPDEFLGGVLVFFLKLPGQEDAGVG
jgi:hypothetical protein